MKYLVNAIKQFVNANKRMAECESWVKYLEKEIDFLNHKSAQDNIAINELIRENEIISGDNTRLIKEIESVRNIAGRMREKLYESAATPKEHEFLNVCARIHDSGKVIKGRTFSVMMAEALRERRSAVNGRFGGGSGVAKMWGDRACPKGN
ncbi:hypothetical protein CB337_04120 [Salmonella enterica subsp. enterica serovar Agbeni]|nr:hypothetical protein [Salmonella enterica subsp. enterica serovar Agbeni]